MKEVAVLYMQNRDGWGGGGGGGGGGGEVPDPHMQLLKNYKKQTKKITLL